MLATTSRVTSRVTNFFMILLLLLADKFDFIFHQRERNRRANRENLILIGADNKFADIRLDIELIVPAEERADQHLAGNGVDSLLPRRKHADVYRQMKSLRPDA